MYGYVRACESDERDIIAVYRLIFSNFISDFKFRLRHCGIQKKIFLIESFDSMKHFSISEDRIHQAIANTEVSKERLITALAMFFNL